MRVFTYGICVVFLMPESQFNLNIILNVLRSLGSVKERLTVARIVVSSAEPFHSYSFVRAAYLHPYISCARMCLHRNRTGIDVFLMGSNGGSYVLSDSVIGGMGLNVG